TSEVFLGLTLGCARCHDHKFEPLTSHDYYRMVAVFRGLDRPRDNRTERALPVGTPAELAAEARRDARIAGLKKALDATKSSPSSPSRAFRSAALTAEIARLHRQTPDLPRAYILHEPSPKPPQTFLLLRGQATALGPRVGPGVPAVLVKTQPDF